MKVKRLFLSLILCLAFCNQLLAQLENHRWYFGHYAIIDFNSGHAVADSGSKLHSIAGCAAMANGATGATQFYSNGLDVWNAQNHIMPHGDGLMAGPTTSATQGVLIVAYPGKDSTYLIFTTDESNHSNANGLRYSMVDMRLDSGRGDIVTTYKNIPVAAETGEHLEIAQGRYGRYYWIVTHKRNSNKFLAFKLDTAGLHNTPVISSVGSVHDTGTTALTDGNIGQLKFNYNFTRLAVALHGQNKIEIFDFDNSTGVISNPTSISTPEPPYGVEFSPEGSKLYYSLARGVYQLDMTLPLSDLQLSVTPIGYSYPGHAFGDMQLAPDGKIYIAVDNANWLSALADPPKPGAACGFTDTAIRIGPFTSSSPYSHLGLPHVFIKLPEGGTEPGYGSGFELSDSCNSGPLQFSFNNISNVISITWNFDDPESSMNMALGNEVTHQFEYAGRYRVTAVIHTEYFDDTIARYVNVVICHPGSDTPECKIYMPDAFTPNGDGMNDEFRAFATCATDYYNFRVYNRWGEVIFATENPREKWDGNYKNKPCEIGVYYWVTEYKFTGFLPSTQVGQITLVR